MMPKAKNAKEDLLRRINKKREEMNVSIRKYGMKNDRTLQVSQELDQLIVLYQKLLLD